MDQRVQLGGTLMGGERAARAMAAYRAAKDPRGRSRRERLTEDEIFSFFQLLLLAGTETTTNLTANAVVCLLDHSAQLARVRAEPKLVPAAIEETMRFRTPVQLVFRCTTQSVELRGRTIEPGALVLPVVGSANRDAGHFREPHRFDIMREAVPHVGFGHGIHLRRSRGWRRASGCQSSSSA